MSTRTVTFRTQSENVKDLDRLAAAQQRDRTFLLNEAIEQYLSLQKYHLSLIEEGLEAEKAGQLTPHDEVVRLTKSWGKKPRQGKTR
jgi:predicted transcriptional regulator